MLTAIETCAICSGPFSLDQEGGIKGEIGILPVAFCPTCYAGVMDFAEQEIAGRAEVLGTCTACGSEVDYGGESEAANEGRERAHDNSEGARTVYTVHVGSEEGSVTYHPAHRVWLQERRSHVDIQPLRLASLRTPFTELAELGRSGWRGAASDIRITRAIIDVGSPAVRIIFRPRGAAG